MRPPLQQTLEYDPAAGPPRGLLSRAHPAPAGGRFTHIRRAPPRGLAHWIQHYWMVSWWLPPGAERRVESLPHPNIQLVFDDDGAWVHGIHSRKFQVTLAGRSRVFGVKFRAGVFRSVLQAPVATLRDQKRPAVELFGPEVLALQQGPMPQRIAAANRFFLARPIELGSESQLATRAVERALQDATITSVAKLASAAGLGERGLQRLFREHVGASPKAVIQRFRLHELVERLNLGQPVDWAATALELGYFDQAHMIRDFRRLTGFTPEAYRRSRQEGALRPRP